ncbi:putative pentatricopeptide repeat-containing protein [Forsythia ovata]|uniref:Pentatricopeptide repeat-containing protein n=1 Tax=Forsythia ovata TaxID=205694 RepID=A0ABD1SNC1_9LAMI
MIGGYSTVGMVNEAFRLFTDMQRAKVEPGGMTMVSMIYACTMSGALDLEKWLHAYIDKKAIKNDLEVSTALVNMYAKCGCIEKAKEIFEEMAVKDAKVWSSMIVGFAIHGHAEEALETFVRIEEAKIEPNNVTLIGVLLACAHSGLASKGKKYWSCMLESGIEPSIEHYGCMAASQDASIGSVGSIKCL